MRAALIRQVADLMGVSCLGPDKAGWMTLGCPFATTHHSGGRDRNGSMRVEVMPGRLSRWRCWSCSEGGKGLAVVLVPLRALGYDMPFGALLEMAAAEEDELEISVVGLDAKQDLPPAVIPETWLDQFKPAWDSPAAQIYLMGRDQPITIEMQEKWGLRYDVEKRRVIMPIRDFGGLLRGAQGRTILSDAKPKYLHYGYEGRQSGHHFWFGEQFFDFDKPAIIVEGPVDAMMTARVYENVLGAMGSAVLMPSKLERLATVQHLVSMLDPDDAGMVGRDRLRSWCYKRRLYANVVIPNGKDPGSLSPQESAALLQAYTSG